MSLTRRHVLVLASGSLIGLSVARLTFGTHTIKMQGTSRGERVWFTPIGLAIAAGTTVRFVNRDPVNSHTATAYHPSLFGRPRRIPEGAEPWDSDFLLPEASFEVTLYRPGVYDFYCIPHEMAGMVGRIVVGLPTDKGWQDAALSAADLPDAALKAFPDVKAILNVGRIDPGHEP
ncbi:MAG: hypothetical protein H6905_11625 [Hyphomicrobiales bacterium]|nr:hypothetical protein [Hyphomicrobiales bacterium]